MESNAGKATISLRLDLGAPPLVPDNLPHHRPRRTGPSQQRRRERRAAARLAEEAGVSHVAVEAEHFEANNAKTAGEKATEVSNTKQDTDTEEVLIDALEVDDEFCTDEPFHEGIEDGTDCEMYDVTYFDTSKPTEAQDAVNFVNEKMKFNFERYKVKESDRIFKIDQVKRSGEEIVLQIKLKKNCPLKVENALKNMQIFEENRKIQIKQNFRCDEDVFLNHFYISCSFLQGFPGSTNIKNGAIHIHLE